MIERIVDGDALDAREDMLLVPVPIGERFIEEGFAGQVMRHFAEADRLLNAKAGLSTGEFLVVGNMAGNPVWRPAYSLVLAGIHRRQEQGWELADTFLEDVLQRIHSIYTPDRMATAGIPGTGYSGLRGGASPVRMRQILEESPLRISIYQRGPAGDRAKMLEADPPKEDRAESPLPKTPFAEQYLQPLAGKSSH